MSLLYDTSRWCQTVWQGHLAQAQTARTLLRVGAQRQPDFAGFADDVHAALYLPSMSAPKDDAPSWASDILEHAQALPEWKLLKSRCQGRAFYSGVAAESLLRALVPLTPEDDQNDQNDQGHGPGGEPSGGGDQGGSTRRALRKALRAAGEHVDHAESAMEGMENALGLRAGHQPGCDDTLVELEQVRALWDLMAHNDMLKMIAQMAGRLARLAESAAKTKAQSRVGAITGITVGGDLSRILPQELAGLRGGRLARLQVLGKIAGRKALQYDLKGPVPVAKGPLLVLLDKSISMRSPHTRLCWSKAVALALLSLCREQQRTWGCITFDTHVSREIVVEDGQVDDQDALMGVLLQGASGGTDFTHPLARALELLAARPTLKQADIILVTDGKGDIAEDVEKALKARMTHDGLRLYVIGIGKAANLSTLFPLATACYLMSSDPQASEGTMVPMLAALA